MSNYGLCCLRDRHNQATRVQVTADGTGSGGNIGGDTLSARPRSGRVGVVETEPSAINFPANCAPQQRAKCSVH
jgi:hypothetical protein